MPYINVDEVYIIDNTGLQVDQATDLPYTDAGLTESQQAQARANIAAGGSNVNLLDNSFFQVNQRGWTSGTANNVYTVDRWKSSSSAIAVAVNADNSLTITKTSGATGQIYQTLPWADDTSVFTFSVMDGDGNIYTRTATFADTSYTNAVINGVTVRLYLNYNTTTMAVSMYMASGQAGSFTIKACKLEKGSVSTLANDAPPNYAEELLKCQRYFIRLNAPYTGNGFAVGRAVTDGTNCRVFFPLPVTLRTSPTVSVSGLANLQLFGNGSTITPTAVSYSGRSENGVSLQFTASSLTGNTLYMLCRGSSDAYIDLSADL